MHPAFDSLRSPKPPAAETAYLFRHALLRDAAYQLQLPTDRARLHALAFTTIEEASGGRPALPPSLDAPGASAFTPHPTDTVARELAGHAHHAAAPELLPAERLYHRRAGQVAEAAYRYAAANEAWLAFAEVSAGVEQAEAIRRAGNAANNDGRAKDAEALVLRAIDAFQRAGATRFEGIAHSNLAIIYFETARGPEAEAEYRRAIALLRASGEKSVEAECLNGLGSLSSGHGRIEEAEQLYREGLNLTRSVGNGRVEGIILGNFSNHLASTGRVAEAEALLEEAMALHKRTGNRRYEGFALLSLGTLRQEAGRPREAIGHYESALAIFRETGDRRSAGSTLANLAASLFSTGDRPAARRHLEQALAVHCEVGNRRSEALTLGNFAILEGLEGRPDAAEDLFKRAFALHRDLGNRRYEGFTWCDYALFLIGPRRLAEARAAWATGVGLLREVRDTGSLARKTEEMVGKCGEEGVERLDGGE